ncbi:MAG: hemoglobin [Bacteroidia bacterium]|jgi:hemoglobin
MNQDITSKEDIEHLVDSFYKKVVLDDVIAHFFTSVVKLSWEKHIPIMHQFWGSVLLGLGTYNGNPMNVHMALNEKSKLETHHFERWFHLWKETVDELFAGSTAEQAKNKAQSMAFLIQSKIDRSSKPGFVH